MKSIKQIADEVGVSKQCVYRYIKSNQINATQQIGSTLYYDETAELRINQHFSDIKSNQATSNNTVVQALLKQLEVKDKQITDLHEVIKELSRSISAVPDPPSGGRGGRQADRQNELAGTIIDGQDMLSEPPKRKKSKSKRKKQ